MSGGESAGSMELLRTSLGEALAYGDGVWRAKRGHPLRTEVEGFVGNFLKARGCARRGTRQRRDMPVLEETDLSLIKQGIVALGDGIYEVCEVCHNTLQRLTPLQSQIYYDISMSRTAEHGVCATLKWLLSQHLFVTHDFQILDGHHRWLSGMLLRPHTDVPVFRFKMPTERVIPFLLDFTREQGRVANE